MGMWFQSGMGFQTWGEVPDLEKPKFPLQVEGTIGDDIWQGGSPGAEIPEMGMVFQTRGGVSDMRMVFLTWGWGCRLGKTQISFTRGKWPLVMIFDRVGWGRDMGMGFQTRGVVPHIGMGFQTRGGVPDMGMRFQTWAWDSRQAVGFQTWGWCSRHGDGDPDMGMEFLTWGWGSRQGVG